MTIAHPSGPELLAFVRDHVIELDAHDITCAGVIWNDGRGIWTRSYGLTADAALLAAWADWQVIERRRALAAEEAA